MNDKFDELAKGLAQSATRRGALKKFGLGFAGVALASLGIANKTEADPRTKACLEAGASCGQKASFCKRMCCSGQYFAGGNATYICS